MAASCVGTDFQVLSNPEFLAEGTAMDDLQVTEKTWCSWWGSVRPSTN